MREVRVGMTLPSFVGDPEVPIAVARAADAAGLDGVFAFDHLYRDGPAGRRPALDCFTILGAVAVETTRVAVGPLVARVTLRPPAALAGALDTLQRVSAGRVVAALGAGDSQNAGENEEYGLASGSVAHRVGVLRAAVLAARDRGYPVWVGGGARTLRDVVAIAEGWNRWGGTARELGQEVEGLRPVVRAGFTFTWGGLAVVGATDGEASEKAARLAVSPGTIVGGPETVARALRPYVDAGAEWVVVAPVDSSNRDNTALLADVATRRRS